jgi:hypothetical protein
VVTTLRIELQDGAQQLGSSGCVARRALAVGVAVVDGKELEHDVDARRVRIGDEGATGWISIRVRRGRAPARMSKVRLLTLP